jgi:hypothetical protein
MEITVVQEPWHLLALLPPLPTGNRDHDRLKFHITLTHATALDADFLLQCPQDSPQPTGDTAFACE